MVETILLALIALVLLLLVVWIVKRWADLTKFYDEVVGEMRKVTWPSREEVTNGTVLVLFVAVLSTIGIWAVDYVLGFMVKLMWG